MVLAFTTSSVMALIYEVQSDGPNANDVQCNGPDVNEIHCDGPDAPCVQRDGSVSVSCYDVGRATVMVSTNYKVIF